MASKYQRVYTAFWRDTRAWSDDERLLGLYLLTCEHRRMEGLFPLPVPYAAHDMAWDEARVAGALAGLVGRGWALHDGEWVLLVNALRHDQPNRGNQMKSAAKAVEGADRQSSLYRRFYDEARRYSPEFADMLHEPQMGTPETHGRPSGLSTLSTSSSTSTSNSSSNSSSGSAVGDPPTAVDVDGYATRMHVAGDVWRTVVEPVLATVTDWQAALMDGAGSAVCDLIATEPDAPWDRIAAAAAAARRSGGGMQKATPHGAMRAVVESWKRGSLAAPPPVATATPEVLAELDDWVATQPPVPVVARDWVDDVL